ncbi:MULTISPECIES: transcription termination factor Rho [Parvimonas]|uniref:Transcription termination factor Rho n=1 Tax=Parvimonas micra TaxID=33033 RepID=A0A9X3HAR7_9FIRM|nr:MULTISPECIES: transcription termination factor Rho [Parvimonas]MBF1295544.1 transcription termination factor Rho [Parvimonas sp.]MCZ7407419.1 transcription termination factor Rho [Parvimonas micra]MCZ7410198.1 transcription termination factor Rho [Parvimonas micra]MCZ7412027.1 transcription termination factor Rho [Parvimonas micra]WBB37106.1 transcription termination factor Rho [Parvimonas micra]
MNIELLKGKYLDELKTIAKSYGIANVSKYKKNELISEILKADNGFESEESERVNINEPVENETDSKTNTKTVCGLIDITADGYGFLRSNGYDSGEEDIYVSPTQIRRFRLKKGDKILGLTRESKETEKFSPLIYINEINDIKVSELKSRKDFDDLIPIYPNEKYTLETEKDEVSTRIIDFLVPIGKGQRALIVAPPKAGKTSLLRSILKGVEINNPKSKIFVLLIGERPEEVTEMKRFTKAEVIASTFDELPQNHIRLAEFVLERAKRLVELGEDVVILVDSITRLSRAYNVNTPSSGKTLTGGLDPFALHKPKRFFGSARNVENGGSLTIIATTLVDTGSKMDDMIYEEFKGTGNMEIHLSRKLSELRIFPAIDIYKSGTRKDDLLLTEEEIQSANLIRRKLSNTNTNEIMENLVKNIKKTENNKEFFKAILKNN